MSATIVQTPALVPSRGRKLRHALVIAAGALALACGSAAQAAPGWHGGWHGGHVAYRGGWGWGWDPLWGVGLGLGLGLVAAAPYYVDQPNYVVVNPPVYYPPAPPVYVPPAPAAAPAAADPIFYPRNGQSPAQTEADRQACNRWATTQHNAMADASVFQRATFACMEGRGYTVR